MTKQQKEGAGRSRSRGEEKEQAGRKGGSTVLRPAGMDAMDGSRWMRWSERRWHPSLAATRPTDETGRTHRSFQDRTDSHVFPSLAVRPAPNASSPRPAFPFLAFGPPSRGHTLRYMLYSCTAPYSTEPHLTLCTRMQACLPKHASPHMDTWTHGSRRQYTVQR